MIRSLAGVSVGWLGISMVADGVPALVVPHRLAASGGDATALGLLTLVAIGLAAVVQPFAGLWSDRIGRTPVIVAGVSLALAGMALLLMPGRLVPGTILALVGVGVAQAAYQPLLADRVASARRGRGAGAKGLFDVGGAFLAFALLGALLADGNVVLGVVVLAVGLVGSLAAALALIGRSPPGAAGASEALPASTEGDTDGLARLIVARFLFLLGIYAVGRFLLMFTADRLGADADAAAGDAGAALALLALVTALAALPAGWLTDRVGRGPLMLGGGVVGAAGIAGLVAAGSLPAIVGFGTLMAIGTAAFGAANWAALADAGAGPRSGRLLGIANFGTAGAAAAAGLFGPLIDAADALAPGAGYGVAFAVAAGVAVVGGVVGWRAPRPLDRPRLRALEVSR